MNTIVITGASRGIGRSLCHIAIEKKFKVIAIDINIESFHNIPNIIPYEMDVSDSKKYSEFKKWYSTIQKEPPLYWFNNAGIACVDSFLNISEAAFNKVIEVNLLGTIYGTRTALEWMNQSSASGKIINIASMNGIIPAPFMSAYAASKYAVVGFTRSLQMELEFSKKNIGIILVLPGFVATQLTENHSLQLPEWFKNKMEDPDKVAQEIWAGVLSNKKEFVVTSNGKWMNRMYRVFPKVSAQSSRFLIAKDWREVLGLDPIEKD